jgi:hypothetical protein
MKTIEFQTDTPEVIVRCTDSDSVVRFSHRRRADKDSVYYSIEALAPNLSARVEEIVAAGWQSAPDLPGFLESLAGDFHGWSGERTWHTLDRDLTISAVFHSGGHVGLNWTLRPWQGRFGGWQTTVTTWQEAGEQMAALAADVRAFLQ